MSEEVKKEGGEGKMEETDGKFDDATNTNTTNESSEPNNNHRRHHPLRRKPGHTVLLNNMVGPEEVNDDLTQEVWEECEKQCGTVVHVDVNVSGGPNDDVQEAKEKEAKGQGGDVRVFVTFEKVDSARKAEKVFHGRMFGNRKIRVGCYEKAVNIMTGEKCFDYKLE